MKNLTVEEIEKQLTNIKTNIDDTEVAHILEDRLLKRTLRAIAKGVSNPEKLAKAAMKVSRIKFSRWYG